MDQVMDRAGKLNSNVEIGKFTALVMSVGTYTPDGIDVPSASNVGPVAGVAQESILPNGLNDYSGGTYQITSGTAWPSGSTPSAATGRTIGYRRWGRSKAIAASAIAVGDRVNIADSQGRLKTVNEVSGTLIHEVGVAVSPASAAGDVFWVDVMPIDRMS